MSVLDAAAGRVAAEETAALRPFGRFGLRKLLGKSGRTMAWRAFDPRLGRDVVLVLPRQRPAGPAVGHWLATVRRAARVGHPGLAPIEDVGVIDGWPWLAHDAAATQVLVECLEPGGLPGAEVAPWMHEVVQGLAFAHEAGIAHHDVQPYLIAIGPDGRARLLGLEAASTDPAHPTHSGRGATALDASVLAALRQAFERDVLALGLVMHHALVGQPALGDADAANVIDRRLPPGGRDPVRLPWTTTHPIPEALRAIANRCTDRSPPRRYRTARSLARALEGWLKAEADAGDGALALLRDRLDTVGLLPASPGAAERAARLALMVRERINELAEIVMHDLALTFELLRMVNTAHVRGIQVAGQGPVLTVRRAIAMLGLDGVRRGALALRPWPGAAGEANVPPLRAAMARARHAARTAQALRPPGYDAEVVGLVTLLQHLGPLALQYHFPDEAAQIRRLIRPPADPRGDGGSDVTEVGIDATNAAYAVLGTSVESLGIAIARHWGLDATVLHMLRRLPTTAPVRAPDNDDDVLRAVASCANEAIDALALPAAERASALQQISARYARALGTDLKALKAALDAGPPALATAAPSMPSASPVLSETLPDPG